MQNSSCSRILLDCSWMCLKNIFCGFQVREVYNHANLINFPTIEASPLNPWCCQDVCLTSLSLPYSIEFRVLRWLVTSPNNSVSLTNLLSSSSWSRWPFSWIILSPSVNKKFHYQTDPRIINSTLLWWIISPYSFFFCFFQQWYQFTNKVYGFNRSGHYVCHLQAFYPCSNFYYYCYFLILLQHHFCCRSSIPNKPKRFFPHLSTGYTVHAGPWPPSRSISRRLYS